MNITTVTRIQTSVVLELTYNSKTFSSQAGGDLTVKLNDSSTTPVNYKLNFQELRQQAPKLLNFSNLNADTHYSVNIVWNPPEFSHPMECVDLDFSTASAPHETRNHYN